MESVTADHTFSVSKTSKHRFCRYFIPLEHCLKHIMFLLLAWGMQVKRFTSGNLSQCMHYFCPCLANHSVLGKGKMEFI